MYPSYPGDAAPGNGSKVLIASYCLSEDADRLGALIRPDGTAELELIDLVFRDLAAVHGLEVDDIKKYYREGDYFAWDWLHDPLTMGWSFLPATTSTLLNRCYRWRAILRSGRVRQCRYLRCSTSTRSSRQTLLRWRGGQRR